MQKVLILGASGGIGSALVGAFESHGADVTPLSRSVDGFDITDPVSVDAQLGTLSGYDGVVVATGALAFSDKGPEKTIKSITPAEMERQFQLNAMGPALVLRHAHRLLRRDGRSVFAVLSARVGSIGDNRLGGWISYRASKAALNQIVRTSAIELARTHKQSVVVALHPGTVATAFTQNYAGRHATVPPAEAADNLLRVLADRTPQDTGKFFDWQGKEVPG